MMMITMMSEVDGEILVFAAGPQKTAPREWTLNMGLCSPQASVSADVAAASVETPVDERRRGLDGVAAAHPGGMTRSWEMLT